MGLKNQLSKILISAITIIVCYFAVAKYVSQASMCYDTSLLGISWKSLGIYIIVIFAHITSVIVLVLHRPTYPHGVLLLMRQYRFIFVFLILSIFYFVFYAVWFINGCMILYDIGCITENNILFICTVIVFVFSVIYTYFSYIVFRRSYYYYRHVRRILIEN